MKFALKPTHDPLVDVVIDIETALKFKSESVKYNVRSETKRVLKDCKSNEKYKPTHQQKDMHEIVKNLNNKDVYYIKADKGNSIIIMDKHDYNEKMLDHITSGNYRKVKNPLNKMIKSTKVVINKIINVFRDNDGNVNKKMK